MSSQPGLVVQRPSTPLPRWRPLPILLLDVSASMGEGQPRRIDLLWEAVQALRTPQARWRVAVFSERCRWRDGQEIPTPCGNTNLADAFVEVGKVRPTSITLVTDGEPDEADAAHAAGLALRCPIHILYVGDPTETDAVEFCRGLCAATKGTFATEVLTLASRSAVAATVHKMLGAAPPASIPLGGPTS